MRTWSMFFVLISILFTGCTSMPTIKKPEVSLVSIEPTKTKGFSQYFALNLMVSNPNSFDLDIEGVTFNLGVAEQKVLAGMSNSVPVLKAYSETPVTITAGVGLFDLLKLLNYFSQHHKEELTYHLTTTIDPNGFIPFTISREGKLSDDLLSGLKQGKKGLN